MSDTANDRRAALNPGKPRLRLRLAAAAESIVRGGHPWVFSDSIREQNREGITGELAAIYDRNDKFLAIGLYDPESPIRVRILHAGKPTDINHSWWTKRLEPARRSRGGLFGEDTDGYRCINGESEGWPGLILDRYNTTYVLKLYTSAWLPHLQTLLPLFKEALAPERLVLRLSRNIQSFVQQHFTKTDGDVLSGPALSAPIIFKETGLFFEAEVLRGQKTGFFLDQRENRREIERLADGRHILNAFSFSGGFSLYAARGGAASVTDLDISAHALDSSRRNFWLNQQDSRVNSCAHELVKANAFDWLNQNHTRNFDLIILDPPSLAKREGERAGALRAYQALVRLALKHLRRGAILVACSCSAHVTAGEFFGAVREAAMTGKTEFVELFTRGHPPDHPATFPGAEYLKAIYLHF